MFRCHANPAISRRIGRVGAEVSKKKAKKGQERLKTLYIAYRIVSGYLKQRSITKRVPCYGYKGLQGSQGPRVQGPTATTSDPICYRELGLTLRALDTQIS